MCFSNYYVPLRNMTFEKTKQKQFDKIRRTLEQLTLIWVRQVSFDEASFDEASFDEAWWNPAGLPTTQPGGLAECGCMGWSALTQGWMWGMFIYWGSCDTPWWKQTLVCFNGEGLYLGALNRHKWGSPGKGMCFCVCVFEENLCLNIQCSASGGRHFISEVLYQPHPTPPPPPPPPPPFALKICEKKVAVLLARHRRLKHEK